MALDTRIISIPVEVPATMSDEEAQQVAREAFAMQMYAQDKVTSSQAAQMLGISRWEFLRLTGSYRIPVFDETLDLDGEATKALHVSDNRQP